MPRTALNQGEVARLLMQHRTTLYGFIFACVRHHADAEDILQNVGMAVMESFGQLRDEAGFLPWAREIARRRVLAHRRQRGRESSLDPEVVRALAEAADRVEEKQPASAHHAALLTCLEALPPDCRQLLAQRYDGVDATTLSTRFGRSVQAVYALIKRLKVALRQCVERRLAAGDSPE